MITRRNLISASLSLPSIQRPLSQATAISTGSPITQWSAEITSATSFGARGDGRADDTNALQLAWTEATKRRTNLLIPSGDYRLTSTISGLPLMLYGAGQGNTRLIFEGMSGRDGISFQPGTSANSLAGAAHMTIIARGENGRRAIATPRSASYFALRPHYNFENLIFEGSNGVTYPDSNTGGNSIFSFGRSGWVMDNGWDVYIDIGDSWSPTIKNCEARGVYKPDIDPTIQPPHVFIRLSAERGIISARVADIFTHNIWGGIELGDRTLLYLDRADIAQSYIGLFTNVLNKGYAEAWINASAFNAQCVGIRLSGAKHNPKTYVHITDCQSVRDGRGAGSPDGWHGFLFENIDRLFMSNCRSEGSFKSARSKKAISYRFVDCDWFQARALGSFGNVSTAFEFDACTHGLLEGLLVADLAQTCFDFRNGTRDVEISSQLLAPRSGSKTYQFDSTIVQQTIKTQITSPIVMEPVIQSRPP